MNEEPQLRRSSPMSGRYWLVKRRASLVSERRTIIIIVSIAIWRDTGSTLRDPRTHTLTGADTVQLSVILVVLIIALVRERGDGTANGLARGRVVVVAKPLGACYADC